MVSLRPWSPRDAPPAWGQLRSPHAGTVLSVALALLGLLEVGARALAGGLGPQAALAVALLALAGTLSLLFIGPEAAALVSCGTAFLSLAGFRVLSLASGAAVLVGLYRLGRGPRGHRLSPLWALSLDLPFLGFAFGGPRPSASEPAALGLLLAVLVPAALLGGLAQGALEEVGQDRAARRVIAETLVEQAARGERARIAHELHDVVAHHISMVAVQAEAARVAVPGMPAAGAQRLAAIGDTARTALVEMRGLLGVLRQDAGRGEADRHPQPGLDRVTDLIDEAREASGCATRLILRGTPIAIDPNVGLVAYRIVQEALTNSRRHAPGAAVDVELAYMGDHLHVRVRDNGPGPTLAQPSSGQPSSGQPSSGPPSSGHGVTGMRERAVAIGGSVRTGSATGGGYLVEAVLPAQVEARP